MRSMPFHYGWVILASGALGSFMTTPGQTYGVSPFFDPVAHDLGLSRAAVATTYTIGTLAGVLPAPFVGRWIDRRGPRVAGVLIGLALAVACVVMASSSSALSLTIGFAALRGAAIRALSLVSQHGINLWFVTRRGLAAGAVSFALASRRWRSASSVWCCWPDCWWTDSSRIECWRCPCARWRRPACWRGRAGWGHGRSSTRQRSASRWEVSRRLT